MLWRTHGERLLLVLDQQYSITAHYAWAPG